MEPYDPDAVCPKCGFEQVKSEYVSDGDFLVRECLRCEHEWNETPLDTDRKAETDG